MPSGSTHENGMLHAEETTHILAWKRERDPKMLERNRLAFNCLVVKSKNLHVPPEKDSGGAKKQENTENYSYKVDY
jgi:hypothetical protein